MNMEGMKSMIAFYSLFESKESREIHTLLGGFYGNSAWTWSMVLLVQLTDAPFFSH